MTVGNPTLPFKGLFAKTISSFWKSESSGRQKAHEQMMQRDKDHKSMATAITLERNAVLNRKRKHIITLDIIDLKDESDESRGTRVVFEVPLTLTSSSA